jgi:hypothetical protein
MKDPWYALDCLLATRTTANSTIQPISTTTISEGPVAVDGATAIRIKDKQKRKKGGSLGESAAKYSTGQVEERKKESFSFLIGNVVSSHVRLTSSEEKRVGFHF